MSRSHLPTPVAGSLRSAHLWALIFGLCAAAPVAGRECLLEVELEPEAGRLAGVATWRLGELDELLQADGSLPLVLHEALSIDSASWDGIAAEAQHDEAGWAIELPTEPGPGTLAMRWSGTLRQDVSAGERSGQIHNLQMSAHVAPEGVYLEPDAAWHPQLDGERAAAWHSDEPPGCAWTLQVESPLLHVASGDPLGDEGTGWTTPFELPGVALVGGPHRAASRRLAGVDVRVHTSPHNSAFADDILQAVGHYLELYQPLIGAYPFERFTVVENFFSSGFAFPGFTLLSAEVIRMGERSLRPGYLDHELLHNWWGNGVLSSQAGSHWSEAVATYCANYMRPVLEGHEGDSRAWRRGVVQALSRSSRLAGQAVGDFGREPGIDGFVGYQKGAFVLDQLAREIGREELWAGLRRFATQRFGRPSTWSDLRAALEATVDKDLSTFFEYWIEGPGLPEPSFGQPRWHAGAVHLRIAHEAPVGLLLPVDLHFAQGPSERQELRIEPGGSSATLVSARRPSRLVIDPDYEALRILPAASLMPTLSALAPPGQLTVVLSRNDHEPYGDVLAALERRFSGHGDALRVRHRLGRRALERGHVLLLGQAAQADAAAELFGRHGIEIGAAGFALRPHRWVSPGDALLACVRNDRHPGAFACAYTGNSAAALSQARLLTFYGGNSLVVFQNGAPSHRRDFEGSQQLPVVDDSRAGEAPHSPTAKEEPT
jgi:hypothetical protein